MIRKAWRTTIKFLESADLALWLLVGITVWSVLSSFIPQEGVETAQEVAAWVAAHPIIEPAVRLLGLHRAYTSTSFIACAGLLAVSTALCAWRRTKIAFGKMEALRRAGEIGDESVPSEPDFELVCDPALSESEVLSIAFSTLEHLGIRTRRRGHTLTAVSSPWSVWGSPVFHWALLGIIVVLVLGNLLRSEGQMGLAVGQTKPDVLESYGLMNAGPLRDWRNVHRGIRVDKLDVTYMVDGIDRGPAPIVSVLDAEGRTVKTRRVYPNHTLKTGSLTVYPVDYGLSVTMSLVDSSGIETGRAIQIVDFSEEASDGTAPKGALVVGDPDGKSVVEIAVSVPLDVVSGRIVNALPKEPKARVVMTPVDGTPSAERVLALGDKVALPDGDGSMYLVDVGHYARIQLVDDWSLPYFYGLMGIAMIGLTVTAVARQEIVLVTANAEPDGVKLAATVRLWRNASSSRGEVKRELSRALSESAERSIS